MILSLYCVVVSQFIGLQPWVIFCDGFPSHLTVKHSKQTKNNSPSSSLVFFSYLDRGVHQMPGMRGLHTLSTLVCESFQTYKPCLLRCIEFYI